MLCSRSSNKEEEDSRKVSMLIEQSLKKERQESDEIKILLLGTGSAGKSTFAKQMKAIHDRGYSDLDRETYAAVLPMNALNAMQSIVSHLVENVKLSKRMKPKYLELLSTNDVREGGKNLGLMIAEMWDRQEVQEVYQQRSDLQLSMDSSAEYYFNNVTRFFQPDFIPTEEDMLRARVKTTGIREMKFNYEDVDFTLIDVGGQRSERRKWIHCFDNVTAVIFLAALDEYDLVLEEDKHTNRLDESLSLFGEITGSQFFEGRRTPWILFLNKSDLFHKKIQERPLSHTFPSFELTGEGSATRQSVAFIQDKFEQKFRGDSVLTVFVTCALKRDNCAKVFEAVRESFVRSSMGFYD